MSKTFIKFVMTGIVNTFNYYMVYLLLLNLNFSYLASHISASIVAMIISFYINCYFVYKVKPTLKKFLSFPLTQVVNIGLQTLLLWLSINYLNIDERLAPFLALFITIPITYIVTTFILKDK